MCWTTWVRFPVGSPPHPHRLWGLLSSSSVTIRNCFSLAKVAGSWSWSLTSICHCGLECIEFLQYTHTTWCLGTEGIFNYLLQKMFKGEPMEVTHFECLLSRPFCFVMTSFTGIISTWRSVTRFCSPFCALWVKYCWICLERKYLHIMRCDVEAPSSFLPLRRNLVDDV